jgi:CheY-like chemotaxis protein
MAVSCLVAFNGCVKLLIADDNPAMRSLLRRVCANFATDTRDCETGDDAIRTFAEFKPDWTLMDLSMPGLDGLAATRQIIAQHPNARIVVVTSHHGDEYEQAAREAGACAFVGKENLRPLQALLSAAPNVET